MMRSVSRAARRQIPLLVAAIIIPLVLAYGFEVARLLAALTRL